MSAKTDRFFEVKCIGCGAVYGLDEVLYRCRRCGDLLEVSVDLDSLGSLVGWDVWRTRPIGVWRYRELIPVGDRSKIVSLGEGGTRLIRCRRLAEKLGLNSLYVKFEGGNPTGSFKDRGMTVGVSKALELGFKATICASTGNTSASLAAYSARAGLECFVLVPSGKVALGKLSQAVIHGAKVVAVKGNFDTALQLALKLSLEERNLYLLNSINPFRIEGQKTAAFEVCDQLGRPPDILVIPVGNAGNISAYWKGFEELRSLGLIEEAPRMCGIQAEGANPLTEAYRSGKTEIKPVDNPETVATAIRIGRPVSWKKALKAVRESGGLLSDVPDREILEAQKLLAETEGIFAEPASAASIAGLRRLVEEGEVSRSDLTVCVATGHGLKDPETALKACSPPIEVEASLEELRRILKV